MELVTVRAEIEAERTALADSLEAVGPHAPTACGSWSAFDLAAHVVASEGGAGLVAFGVRTLAAQGMPFRPNPRIVRMAIERQRRDGYHALIASIRGECPRLLLARQVVASTLFELWMHHDDLTSANNRDHAEPTHLALAIPSLMRYQARRLPNAQIIVRTTNNYEWCFGPERGPAAAVSGPAPDLVRWLAGRQPQAPPNIDGDERIADELRAFVGRIG
jgi:uncharacterized protein (TIGR03083 family)